MAAACSTTFSTATVLEYEPLIMAETNSYYYYHSEKSPLSRAYPAEFYYKGRRYASINDYITKEEADPHSRSKYVPMIEFIKEGYIQKFEQHNNILKILTDISPTKTIVEINPFKDDCDWGIYEPKWELTNSLGLQQWTCSPKNGTNRGGKMLMELKTYFNTHSFGY